MNMPIWFAVFLYWHDVITDMSEYPVASGREKSRQSVLKRRRGEERFATFMRQSERSGNIQAFLTCLVSPLTMVITAAGIALFVLLSR